MWKHSGGAFSCMNHVPFKMYSPMNTEEGLLFLLFFIILSLFLEPASRVMWAHLVFLLHRSAAGAVSYSVKVKSVFIWFNFESSNLSLIWHRIKYIFIIFHFNCCFRFSSLWPFIFFTCHFLPLFAADLINLTFVCPLPQWKAGSLAPD